MGKYFLASARHAKAREFLEPKPGTMIVLEHVAKLIELAHFTDDYVKPRENPNFLKKGKRIISVKIQNFSRSQMTKWTSSLELSCLPKSSYPVEFHRIPRQSKFHVFRGIGSGARHLEPCEWLKRCHMSCAR